MRSAHTLPLMIGVSLFSLAMGAPVEANQTLMTQPNTISACSGRFVKHTLPHTTMVTGAPVRLFESNGAGLAINDLNNDGQLDIVFANLDGLETILWNQGDLRFRAQKINIPGKTHAVLIVDVDADGWRDLVFTSQRGAVSWWRNHGDETFEFAALPGVSHPAYSMTWGDLDSDGDLDLVTGSYDAELSKIAANDFLFNGGAGVYYYENQGGTFVATRLADTAQALTILLADLNGDNAWDIAVGNDFGLPDAFWTRQAGAWVPFHPFPALTYSTMSFDVGDVNNDGRMDFFAADMNPISDDDTTRAAYAPVLDRIKAQPRPADDLQIMSNTLHIQEAEGYENRAEAWGVSASGWAWSSKFGDLDSDGWLDLYSVNGMIAQDLLHDLPRGELREPNQAFHNLGDRFVSAPEWRLDALESGRGMSMADLDGDGDLDIVVSNLQAASVLFENQVCGGDNLLVSLAQSGTNPDAIGARLTLRTSTGSYQREVRAASGYLSGDPAVVHFGFPAESQLYSLEIDWPDGTHSRVEDLSRNTHLTLQHL